MSNLSDLLPAGAGAKVATLTASGTLPTGQAVALQSDGTVKAVSETAGGVGSEYVYESAVTSFGDVAYDSVNNKVIAVYRDEGNSNYGTYVVGTVSGTVITWGTPAVWLSALASDIAIASGNGKLLIAFSDGGNYSYGTVIAGAISGSSISFGTKAVIHSGGQLYETYALYFSPSDNPTYAHRYIVGYSQGGARINTNLIEITGTNTISSGGADEPNGSSNGGGIGLAYAADQTGKNIILSFKDGSDSNKIKYARASYSAGSPGSLSFGGVGFAATNGNFSSVAWDTSASKVLLAYKSVSSSNELRYQVGTFSGTEDITWETAVTSTATVDAGTRLVYDATANKSVLLYDQDNDSGKGKVAYVSISGTTATIGTIYDFNGGDTSYFNLAYDSTAGVNTIVFTDRGNSEYGTGVVFRDTTSNNTDFVGITNQAIANSASGEVAVQGGTITNSSLLPTTGSAAFGSEVVYENSEIAYEAIVYDTANDKVVVAYKNTGDSQKGKAAVGTVSGTSISFGTPVDFEGSDLTTYVKAVYDPDNSKVIITWNSNSTGHHKAIVGTVSGTSISFGSPVTYEASAGINYGIVYDTSNDKVVITFKDGSNSNYGTAIVGTVSGTSISFGTKVVIKSQNLTVVGSAFDSTNNKVLISYQQDLGGSSLDRSELVVGTVSGTSISFGTALEFVTGQAYNQSIAHDTSTGKNVVVYRDINNSSYGTAVVATISGTDVTIGTAVVFEAGATQASTVVYDPTTNTHLIVYKDADNSDYGTAIVGTVSGTDITFGSPTIFNAANPGGILAAVKDPDQNKVVIAYTDYGNSAYGTAIVGTISNASPSLTVGSTYYVQNDGTLSTSSTSVTAGKALSATTLLLKG